MKKKYTLLIICLILILFLVSCINLQPEGQYFLVQIIPDNNQDNTDKITNSLNLYLSNILSDCKNNQEINDKITNNWEDISKLLDDYEMEYSAKITTKDFSEICFNDQTLHKEKYPTLVINFGKAEKNSQFLLYSTTVDNGKVPVLKSRIIQNI